MTADITRIDTRQPTAAQTGGGDPDDGRYLTRLVAAAGDYLAALDDVDDPDCMITDNQPAWDRYDRARRRFETALGYSIVGAGLDAFARTLIRFAPLTKAAS